MSKEHKPQQSLSDINNPQPPTTLDHQQEENGGLNQPLGNYGECRTPTSRDHKIPRSQSCPPAPRKKKQVAYMHKRKLSDMDFFEFMGRDEVESFFRSSHDLSTTTSTVTSFMVKKRNTSI